MKKTLSLVVLVLVSLSNAYGEDRLFPTDILNKGEVDIHLTLDRDTHSSDIDFKGNSGRSSVKSTTEDLQIRYGLGSNWHIGLAVPYASQSVIDTDYNSPSSHNSNTSNKGAQNPVIWATYGILNDKTSALSLNAEVLVRPDTTGNVKTSYTGRLTSGWKVNDALRLYARVSAETFDDNSVPNAYNVVAGGYVTLSESLTLIPHASYVQFTSANSYSAYDQTDVGLSANIRIVPNFYLIPSYTAYRNGASHSDNGFFHRDATNNGKAISLGAYYLF